VRVPTDCTNETSTTFEEPHHLEQPRILARENVRPFTVEKQVVNLEDEEEDEGEYEEINSLEMQVH